MITHYGLNGALQLHLVVVLERLLPVTTIE